MAESVAGQDLERRRLVAVVKVLRLVDRPFNAPVVVAVASLVAFAEETFNVDVGVIVIVIVVAVVVRVRHGQVLRFREVESEQLGLVGHEGVFRLVEAERPRNE